MSTPFPQALPAGHLLAGGAYTVRRALATGGMSTVYLAADERAFGRTVVIKTLRPYWPRGDVNALAEAQSLLEHEARTLAALRHPLFPQIYACFREGPAVCLALEYVEGRDLEWGLTRFDPATATPVVGRPYPRAAVLDWGSSLCQALEYLHAQSPAPVLHRDIKPANLLLDRATNTLRLIDFGTAVGGGYGTPGYAAPEQYRDESSPASDVYALAATLYHLLTDDDPSHRPFHFPLIGALGTLGAVLRAALNYEADRRPTLAALRQQLDVLRGAAHTAPIVAPDGTTLADIATLGRWCERNPIEAFVWLRESLPSQLELWWRDARRAHLLRLALSANTHPADALDAAFAVLAPT